MGRSRPELFKEVNCKLDALQNDPTFKKKTCRGLTAEFRLSGVGCGRPHKAPWEFRSSQPGVAYGISICKSWGRFGWHLNKSWYRESLHWESWGPMDSEVLPSIGISGLMVKHCNLFFSWFSSVFYTSLDFLPGDYPQVACIEIIWVVRSWKWL